MVRHHTQFDVESKIDQLFVTGFFPEGQVTLQQRSLIRAVPNEGITKIRSNDYYYASW